MKWGTGKEVVARYVHRASARESGPFVAINYHWPGNVRELRNALERAAILCEGLIAAEHLRLTDGGSAPAAVPPGAGHTN